MHRFALAAIITANVVAAIVVAVNATSPPDPGAAGASAAATSPTAAATPERPSLPAPLPRGARRDVSAFRGLGTWVDVYDFSAAYAPNGQPTVTPSMVPGMAARGVRTLYLQVSKQDPRTTGDIESPEVVARFLTRAHRAGLRVVAWYLPKFDDPAGDMRRLLAIRDFRARGQRFDAIGIDIEDRATVADPPERSARLVELSRWLRGQTGATPLAAIVVPPVLMDVVNPRFWPAFPWAAIGPYYDVWMPMSYWTFRNDEWRDARRYTEENVRRLRAHLGNPGAVVHPIGGIADQSSLDDVRGFVAAAAAGGCVGGSIYDWATSAPAIWDVLRDVPA